MSTMIGAPQERDVAETARRRTGLVAAVTGLVLMSWF
jgi:hypothetical protein